MRQGDRLMDGGLSGTDMGIHLYLLHVLEHAIMPLLLKMLAVLAAYIILVRE
jgi:hypothetical protein